MKPWLVGAILIASLCPAAEPLGKGFDHFYSLEYEEAIAEFAKDVKKNPADAHAHNHLAQAILYREMYNAGSLESELVSGNNPFISRAKIIPPEADQQRFENAVNQASQLSEARIAKNPQDADAIYTLGVAHGLRANYNFLIRKLWREALREFTLSRKLHNQVSALQPDNVDAQMVQGVHDYIVGSLSWSYKMLGFLMGFHGDKEGGLRTLERVAEKGNVNRVDAMILLGVAYRREREAEKAVLLLNRLIQMYPRNHLYRLEMVQMYADLGKKDEALAVLQKMDELKASGAAGYKDLPSAKIQYSRGNLLFWYREYPAALENLRKVTADSRGISINTHMNAWLRMGQTLDQMGQREQAVRAYRQAVEGAPDSDAGKEAKRYLSSPYRRS